MRFDWHDTIIGLATGIGSGARAILRITGPASHELVENSLTQSPSRSPWRRPLVWSADFRLDSWSRNVPVDVYTWAEGRSYTGQPAVELHVFGCAPLAAAVQAQCIAHGMRTARPGEFTLRAFLGGRLDLLQAESVVGLIHARTTGQFRAAIDQLHGAQSQRIGQLRGILLDLLADLEAGLDFSDDDVRFVSDDALAARLADSVAEVRQTALEFASRAVEQVRPRIVLTGPANAGKSSLFNALVGSPAALVHNVAGTTRDYVSAILNFASREIELLDTAGHVNALDEVSQRAAILRDHVLQTATIVVECRPVGEAIVRYASETKSTLVVRTRHDECPEFTDPQAEIHTSIYSADSIGRLRAALARRLDELVPVEGTSTASDRCRSGLELAVAALDEASREHQRRSGHEIIAAVIREALDALGEITGAVYTDDVLDRVFSRFCIGK